MIGVYNASSGVALVAKAEVKASFAPIHETANFLGESRCQFVMVVLRKMRRMGGWSLLTHIQ